ncbi:RIP metalloprotease RseP [Campylobacter pinnipediorum]|uniref:RIP metalloprotease RseP n=1 Tax=Campylobacter pinnipediorum TaxID=1965231 RepID=UPI000994D38F|nr:RIP metalloprotease RseP [Campylobacter pinnipediorum]AQW83195.1 RseP-like zinc metalloprotease [Campylobacter pinnipediorum subsp. pinnipediorum]AQW84763.1 RseP-like zinc metalloprotease [Campylobacter pinnipediorum subsp. pinnipediorum]
MKSIFFVILMLIVGIYAYSWHFFVTIFVISFLIFFHELGHFLVARFFGVCVNTFSIGFGEKIFTKRVNNTDYCISAIPLGGYVQLKGQDDTDPKNRNYDSDSYNTLSPIKRILILFAGPFFNLILAFFIYISLGFMGNEKLAPIVGTVLDNSAAKQAGIMVDDKILMINNKIIKEWDDIGKQVSINPTKITLQRDDKQLTIKLTPKIGESKNIFGETIQKPLIGISPKGDFVKVYHTGFSSISYAFDETIKASKLIFLGFEKIITGIVPIKEMGGIVQITDITSKAAKTDVAILLLITALISVNLGILNLLPIPALDGGHIIFNAYELIFKKEVSEKVFAWLTYIGWAILLTMMLVATFNDIMRLGGFYK